MTNGTELTTAAREAALARRRSRSLILLASHVGWALIALVVASLIIFFSLHYLPGDQATIIGGVNATEEQKDLIRQANGWDQPVVVQYWTWASSILSGDFGTSALTGKSVSSELWVKLQVTLPLAFFALVLAIVVSFAVGIFAAARNHTWAGRCVSWLTQLGIAVPSFIVGLGVVALIALPTRWFPATGFPLDRWASPVTALHSLILPAVTLAIPLSAILIRYVRSAVLEQIGQDYVRTARAQGMSRRQAFVTQALRNASLPVLSVIALDTASLLLGTVIVEQVFALPGVGYHLLQSVSNRDIIMVQGFLMALTAGVILLMMITNIIASLLDPRVRLT